MNILFAVIHLLIYLQRAQADLPPPLGCQEEDELCGLRFMKDDPPQLGRSGSPMEVKKGVYPWVTRHPVYIGQSTNETKIKYCVGAVIHRRFVVTTRGCYYRVRHRFHNKDEKMLVNVGVYSGMPNFKTSRPWVFGAYWNMTFMVIKMPKELPLGGKHNIMPICLPVDIDFTKSGKDVIVIGFGCNKNPDVVTVEAVRVAVAQDNNHNTSTWIHIEESQKNECLMKEGSSIMVKEISGRFYLLGLATDPIDNRITYTNLNKSNRFTNDMMRYLDFKKKTKKCSDRSSIKSFYMYDSGDEYG